METLTVLFNDDVIALSRDGQTFWLDSSEAQQVVSILSGFIETQEVGIGTKTSRKK